MVMIVGMERDDMMQIKAVRQLIVMIIVTEKDDLIEMKVVRQLSDDCSDKER